MTDIALDPIGSGYNLSKFNTNFQALEDKINDEILHLTGGNNLMEQNLDMNSNRILNLPKPESAGEPVINSQLLELASADTGSATNIIYEDPEGSIHQVDDFLDTLEDDVRNLEDIKVENLSDITDIADLDASALVEGQKFHMTGWRTGSDLGGGDLYYDATRPQTDHDGGTVFALGATPPTDFNDPAKIEAYLNAGSGLSGNGCLVRAKAGPKSIHDFGAHVDLPDNHGPAQSCLDTQRDIVIPQGVFVILSTLITGFDGQEIKGFGVLSDLKMGTDNLNVINIVHKNVHIHDMTVEPPTDRSSTFNGLGIFCNGKNRPLCENIRVVGGRSGGIVFQSVFGGRVVNSYHTLSDFDPSTDGNFGVDVAFYDACQKCTIDGLYSDSAIGAAAAVQTTGTDPHVSKDNRLINITTKDQPGYGIFAYTSDSGQSITGTRIVNPVIEEVTGAAINGADGSQSFGAGIYLQRITKTLIQGGRIFRTNVQTDSELLAPGAIGINAAGDTTVIGTEIEDAQWYGVAVFDPQGFAAAEEAITLVDVKVTGSVKNGVYQKDHKKLYIRGGYSKGGGSNGLQGVGTTQTGLELKISGGWESSGNSGSGITVDSDFAILDVKNAKVSQNSVQGVNSQATFTSVDGGEYKGNSLVGLRFNAAKSGYGYLGKTEVTGNGTGVEDTNGIVQIERNNRVSGNTTDYAGTLNASRGYRSLDDTGTPSVKNGLTFSTGGTTEITDFIDAADSQEITIRVAHTITILGESFSFGDGVKYAFLGGAWARL